mmetsp:Transcript_30016/g.41227  ORF Transcript_30016/g.41227 Transcript_30016/m.41227 type:complete len:122 (-) Transcript_30016:50-415(-)
MKASQASSVSGFGAITQVAEKVKSEYSRTLTKKLLMIDALLVYSVATNIVQFIYVLLVGTFPFNSFLSSFICHLGIFAVGVSLRLQLTSSSEFKDISEERAFGDFVFCLLVLFFIVFSFLG